MATKKRVSSKNKIPINILNQKKSFKTKLDDIKKKSPDILLKYIEHMYSNENLRTVNINTALDYSKKIYLFFEFLIDTQIISIKNIKSITTKHLDLLTHQEIEQYLLHCSSTTDDYGATVNTISTVINKQTVLKTFFKWMYLNDYISKNETEKLRKIHTPQRNPVIALCDDEVKSILDLALYGESSYGGQGISLKGKALAHHKKTKYRDYAILVMFLHHGLRINELFNLNLSSINLIKKEFTIFRKREKKTTMYFTDKSLQALTNYISLERPLIGEINPDNMDSLFLNSKPYDRKRLSIRQIREIVNKYTDDIFRVSPHKLRSTFGTKALELTGNLYAVQQAMDHSNPNTTQLYLKDNEKSKRAVSSAINY